MRRGAALLLVSASAAAPVACSSFGSSTVAPVDAAIDGATDDGGALDGSGRPTRVLRLPGPEACILHEFRRGPLGDGFSGADVSADGGAIALDDVAVSPPKSLRATASGGHSCTYARLIYAGQGNVSWARLAFAVRVGDDVGNARFGNVAQLVVETPAEGRVFYVDVKPGGYQVHEQRQDKEAGSAPDSFHDFGGELVAGVWHHLDLVFDLVGGTISVRADDGTTNSADLAYRSLTGPVSFHASAGMSCQGGPDPFEMRIDDFLFDYR